MTNVSVLFVCMGNICRSPMAESVFRAQVEAAGLSDRIRIDSAGTHSYHLGHAPHPETQAELVRRGVEVGDQVSRLVTSADIADFDFVVAMDRANLDELHALAERVEHADRAELSLLLEHVDPDAERAPDGAGDMVMATSEVPDPYYVGGYDHVYDLVEAGSHGLLAHVRTRLDTPPG